MSSDNEQTTDIASATEKPIWHKTNAERIEDIIALLPPREQVRADERKYCEYRVLDYDRARVLVVEWYQDEYTAEQVPEGVRYFTPVFTCGFVDPRGMLYNAETRLRYRAAMVDMHGGIKMTIMGLSDGHYSERMRKSDHWATLISYIKDEHIRNGMIQQLIHHHPDERSTFFDFLEHAHAVHLASFRHGHFSSEPSIVTLF